VVPEKLNQAIISIELFEQRTKPKAEEYWEARHEQENSGRSAGPATTGSAELGRGRSHAGAVAWN
jgi:hypothetical protein